MRGPMSGKVVKSGKAGTGVFLRLAAGALLVWPIWAYSVTDITLFSVSDTHYGRVMGAPFDSLRTATVGNLNALPGLHYPASVGGGIIGVPRGVVMPGDLVDRPYATRWNLFTADYGVNGEGRVKFPVYDGMGNHDFFNYGTNDTTDVITKAFIARNAKRKGIANFDPKNLHYSWDWDAVHFVQLNLFAGFGPGTDAQWDPFGSLDFLKADLEKNVGASGRPVLVLQHFDVDTGQVYYQKSQKEAMVAVLRQYNCIGILHGHTHVERIYKYGGLDVFSDGAAFKGDIMIIRITDGKMFVVNRIGDQWGKLLLEKTISMGQPSGLRRADPGVDGRMDEGFIFGVEGVGRVYAGNRRALAVDICRLDGTVVRRMGITAGQMVWDRRDEAGITVPAGTYLIRIATAAGPVTRKVLI